MRSLTFEESKRIELLTSNSVDFCLIEPTSTGLSKSIMDATFTVRNFLFVNKIHDFVTQRKGQENKVLIKALLIDELEAFPSICSLYRPETKNGDPRIWFSKLPTFARPNDILAIMYYDQTIHVINVSKTNIGASLSSGKPNPLKDLVRGLSFELNSIVESLISKLKIIARKPIPALLSADTAVGRTLEQALGIKINSNKKPDYFGIEIKSFRGKTTNRKTLFAQVPNWELSRFKSSADILNEFGYLREKDHKLYCTVSAIKTNSQSLILKLDNKAGVLNELSTSRGAVVSWLLSDLHLRLKEKHAETFWISAESKFIDGSEHFLYTKAEHTRSPIISQFDSLLEQGKITLDHLIKKTPNKGVVEKGPLFKIRPSSLNELFPPSKIYLLHDSK